MAESSSDQGRSEGNYLNEGGSVAVTNDSVVRVMKKLCKYRNISKCLGLVQPPRYSECENRWLIFVFLLRFSVQPRPKEECKARCAKEENLDEGGVAAADAKRKR